IRNNNIMSDLTPLSKLVNLKGLFLGQNNFFGSLAPLQSCSHLETLYIDNTNLTFDLQYLLLTGHPELMQQAGKKLVTDDNGYNKSNLRTVTTTLEYLVESLSQETNLPTDYQLTNYSQFALRDATATSLPLRLYNLNAKQVETTENREDIPYLALSY
ncbi:9765_t:CDS:2, partial [Funneliformis geosporum]